MNKAFKRLSIFISMAGIVMGSMASEVQSPPPCHTVDISGVDILCYGGNNGSAQITINGGSGDFDISWSNGTNDVLSITNLTAGAYSVQVVDNVTGCSVSAIMTINQPDILAVSLTHEDVNCFGESTASIDLTISGGVTEYSYLWTNGASSEDLNNIIAGQYDVTVTDANGCTVSTGVEVTEPAQALASSLCNTEVSCYDDANASIDIDAWGGTTPYYYSWNTGASSQDLENLPAGNYQVTITDTKGCSSTESVSIANPTEIVWTKDSENNLCFGDTDGFVSVTVNGGTLPYTYQWADSEFMLSYNDSILENLEANSYYVTVTDANGCSFSTDYSVTSPDALVLDITSVNVSLQGGNDGSIDLTVTGGVEDYSYFWSNGLTTEDLTSLVAGEYDVTVTDANACTATSGVIITEPLEPLGFTVDSSNVSCFGGDNGRIQIFPEGGVPPYQISWSNSSDAELINNLTAGWYHCTLTDDNGIEYVDSVEILQPEAISFEYTSVNPACFAANDGSIDVTVAGGTLPYRYQWFDPDYAMAGQAEDVPEARAGEYTLEVMDTLGCAASFSVVLTQPEMIELSLTGEDILCYGASTGWINSDVTGGTSDYTYKWSNESDDNNIANLPAGDYSLTVTDAHSCEAFAELTLMQPDSIEIFMSSTEVSCSAQSDGTASAYAEGGSGAYTFLWNNDEITADIENLTEGFYSVTVTDIFNCQNTDSVFVTKNDVDCINIPSSFTPNADGYNDTWVIRNAYLFPQCHVMVLNQWGSTVFESTGYETEWDGTYEGSVLPSGTYYYMFRISPDHEERTGTVTILK